jgi:hypothetical protein
MAPWCLRGCFANFTNTASAASSKVFEFSGGRDFCAGPQPESVAHWIRLWWRGAVRPQHLVGQRPAPVHRHAYRLDERPRQRLGARCASVPRRSRRPRPTEWGERAGGEGVRNLYGYQQLRAPIPRLGPRNLSSFRSGGNRTARNMLGTVGGYFGKDRESLRQGRRTFLRQQPDCWSRLGRSRTYPNRGSDVRAANLQAGHSFAG